MIQLDLTIRKELVAKKKKKKIFPHAYWLYVWVQSKCWLSTSLSPSFVSRYNYSINATIPEVYLACRKIVPFP